ncbi:MAG: DUF4340 domain-containing protein [Bradymonadales bacterium]|nr:MAG: DUF4340 domain-containing protein [Bradymonadales bacterium]
MKLSSLLFLVVAALGFGLYIHFSAIPKIEKSRSGDSDAEPFFQEDPRFYSRLEMTQSRGEQIVLERAPQGWFLREPIQDLGSQSAMDQLLQAVADFRIKQKLLDAEAIESRSSGLDDFGLESPRLKIRAFLSGNLDAEEFWIGNRNPAGNFAFVLNPKTQNLYLGSLELEFAAGFDAEDYRETRLTTVSAEDFEEVRIQVKGQSELRFVRDDLKGWRWSSHPELPLDQDFVANQISRIALIRATEFREVPKRLFDDPEIRIRVGFREGVVDRRTDESDPLFQGVEFSITRQKRPGRRSSEPDDYEYFGKSDKSAPASIARFHYDNFSKGLGAYVKRSFDEFSEDQVLGLEVKNFGERLWSLERSEAGVWTQAGKELEALSTRDILAGLRQLRNLTAEHFMSVESSPVKENYDWWFEIERESQPAMVYAIRIFPTHQELLFAQEERALKFSLREEAFDPSVWENRDSKESRGEN